MTQAGVEVIFPAIGMELFGDDAYRDPDVAHPILKEELTKLVSAIVAQIWNKVRKKATAQYVRMKQSIEEVTSTFEST